MPAAMVAVSPVLVRTVQWAPVARTMAAIVSGSNPMGPDPVRPCWAGGGVLVKFSPVVVGVGPVCRPAVVQIW